MAENNQKSKKEFFCREYLWAIFEKMATEHGCSKDYLINEAMHQFAKAKNYLPEESVAADGPPTKKRGGSTAPFQGKRSGPPPIPPQASKAKTLYMFFNNKRFPIRPNKDFIIGRISQGTNLAIKDGNISRRHASIVFRNGSFYIQDMGSTNGIEYYGRRIDSKKIEEGDNFFICDYELQFTYRTD